MSSDHRDDRKRCQDSHSSVTHTPVICAAPNPSERGHRIQTLTFRLATVGDNSRPLIRLSWADLSPLAPQVELRLRRLDREVTPPSNHSIRLNSSHVGCIDAHIRHRSWSLAYRAASSTPGELGYHLGAFTTYPNMYGGSPLLSFSSSSSYTKDIFKVIRSGISSFFISSFIGLVVPHRNDLNDLVASGDGAPFTFPRPVSRNRPPRMFGVFAQNAQM